MEKAFKVLLGSLGLFKGRVCAVMVSLAYSVVNFSEDVVGVTLNSGEPAFITS